MATLHLVSGELGLTSCLPVVAPADAVLLLQDGTFAAAALAAHAPAITRGMLAEDALARGVDAKGLDRLDYGDFVAWVERYDRTVTWS